MEQKQIANWENILTKFVTIFVNVAWIWAFPFDDKVRLDGGIWILKQRSENNDPPEKCPVILGNYDKGISNVREK